MAEKQIFLISSMSFCSTCHVIWCFLLLISSISFLKPAHGRSLHSNKEIQLQQIRTYNNYDFHQAKTVAVYNPHRKLGATENGESKAPTPVPSEDQPPQSSTDDVVAKAILKLLLILIFVIISAVPKLFPICTRGQMQNNVRSELELVNFINN